MYRSQYSDPSVGHRGSCSPISCQASSTPQSNAVIVPRRPPARRRFVPDTPMSNMCTCAGPVSCLPRVQGGRGIVSGSTPAPLTHVMGRFSHSWGGHLTSRTHGPTTQAAGPATPRPNAQHSKSHRHSHSRISVHCPAPVTHSYARTVLHVT